MTDTARETIYRRRDFWSFVSGRFVATVAMQVQSVAIGWQIYDDIERTPFALGLVEALPVCTDVPAYAARRRNH